MTRTADPAETTKQLFLDAFARFAAGDPEVLRTVLHEDFVEHSPGNPSGRDAFVDFVAASPLMSARFEMQRVIADAGHVVAHYRLVPPDGPDLAVVDIWRVVDGLITEHWDVVQPVPDDAEVPHGMF
jgi:predicted SnoaL-like aldol condensation-catalyzing enzyme